MFVPTHDPKEGLEGGAPKPVLHEGDDVDLDEHVFG
jgi:hypothetical protein